MHVTIGQQLADLQRLTTPQALRSGSIATPTDAAQHRHLGAVRRGPMPRGWRHAAAALTPVYAGLDLAAAMKVTSLTG